MTDSSTPRVTVVMAVYNAAPFLREAVSSVLAQTYPDFELIAVDDRSTDNSLEILESFSDPRLRILRHEANQGAALTRNDALDAARGAYIAIMDADDICEPVRLERQVAYLDQHPQIGLVGCGIFDNIDARGKVLCTTRHPADDDVIQRTLMQKWCFLHSSIMFHKELQQAVGGYRKAFEPAEDHDLVLRILDRAQAHNIEERLVRYRLNPKGLSVFGHQYMNEMGIIAMRLAHRRRAGEAEDLEREMPYLQELKQRRKAMQGADGVAQRWRDSFYAANRYYGFGCKELCAGRMENARRCFTQALVTNAMFIKAWFGFTLSFMPSIAYRMRFIFRTSLRQLNDAL